MIEDYDKGRVREEILRRLPQYRSVIPGSKFEQIKKEVEQRRKIKQKKREKLKEKILQLDKKYNNAEVGRRVGLSRQRIWQILNEKLSTSVCLTDKKVRI